MLQKQWLGEYCEKCDKIGFEYCRCRRPCVPMTGLTPEQVAQLANDPKIQATIETNKEAIVKQRDTDLIMLGYNQALLDVGQAALPEGWTAGDLQEVINNQRKKLGV